MLDWETLLSHAPLGHKARNTRAASLVHSMLQGHAVNSHGAASGSAQSSPADTLGAYRFLNKAELTLPALYQPLQEALRQRVFDQPLDGTTQRPGAEGGVISPLAEEHLGRWRDFETHPLGCHLLGDTFDHEVDDLDDLALAELVEDDDAFEEVFSDPALANEDRPSPRTRKGE